MTTRRLHQITAVVIFIPSLLLVKGALDLRYYTNLGPGPGFFPFWIASILALLSVLMFVKATLGTQLPLPEDLFPDHAGLLRMSVIPLVLAAAAFLLERIGFGITMLLINLLVLWALGTRSLLTLLLVSLIGSFGIEYLFTHWLDVQLPPTDLSALCPSRLCGE